ncbi:pyridoxamine 5'-phosphate oxidase [Paracoccus hibiscisoli]|uniref:Pyridoxine/pyridoxamine 5'-phosphate oxidase n=1 Tax=Paracoccus hibiscisoli TaxID=2023261 RepID=A0A4U0QMI1_9RHOB|nr:pyridoxamine 5'-phosphate oxidase [Paracoccus hibiscisoli]TJZ82282.1 pyridoxamine 5'-phosphate oxidase [Paracoccus hibiscisoli]
MTDRTGLFAGDDPFDIARAWLAEATATEPNDPNAIALATVDAQGMPDVRMVLLKEIDGQGTDGTFVFYTNYDSAKGRQIGATGTAAFVMHWKSLHRQIRVRGTVTREEGPQADAYYDSRALQSRLGAWASRQSQPLDARSTLVAEVARAGLRHGTRPQRPPFWGGFRIRPVQIEFWADGAFRLHDRFVWTRRDGAAEAGWDVTRLSP